MNTLIGWLVSLNMAYIAKLTKSSTSSLIAVMNRTITKGTNVVYREVGEIPGICYDLCVNIFIVGFFKVRITWIPEMNKKNKLAYLENSSYKNLIKKL